MNTQTTSSARTNHVAHSVRRKIIDRALQQVRRKVVAAGGKWTARVKGSCRSIIGDFLNEDAARWVILYHASRETIPARWKGRVSEATRTAVTRSLRGIGPYLGTMAAMRALDMLCEAWGDTNPVVQRLREQDRESRER
jgi:hypothetical protein